jgi:hypothetical protein
MPQIIKYNLMFALLFGGLNFTPVSGQELTLSVIPAKCFADKSGIIQAKLVKGTAPYIIILSVDSLRKAEIKRSPLLKEAVYSFKDISAGRYFVTTICGDGQIYSQIALIDQPSQLRPGKISVETYPGSESAMDGIIMANPVGGTPPYSFSWQGTGAKGNDNKISGVGKGIYKCNIIDSHGCGPVSATIFLGPKVASKSTSYFQSNCIRDNNLIEKVAHLFNS